MSKKVLDLYTDDDIGKTLDRAAATEEVNRQSLRMYEEHPERYPDGLSDAVRAYGKLHPETYRVYLGMEPTP